MATAKQNPTDPRVQGHSITLGELQRRLGCTSAEARRFLTENGVSYLRIGKRTLIDGEEAHRALGLGQAKRAKASTLRLAAAELVRRSRTRQGLPAKIDDPAVISRIVALLQPVVDD